jgi:hypothetical protein
LSPPSTLSSRSGCYQVFGPEVRIITTFRKFKYWISSNHISYHSPFCLMVLEYLRFTKKCDLNVKCLLHFSLQPVFEISLTLISIYIVNIRMIPDSPLNVLAGYLFSLPDFMLKWDYLYQSSMNILHIKFK